MSDRRWPTYGWWLPLAVLLLAAGLRFWQLGAVPPGFQFDEAHNAIDAVRVLDGQLAVFFPDNGGREPLLTYLHAPVLAVLGRDHTVFALRLVSAIVGVLTVAVVYRATSDLLGDRRLGLLAASFLAVSYWHLHFSRFAIRAVLAPLWTTAALWAWWRALRPRPPAPWMFGGVWGKGRIVGWPVLTGVLLAAAVYSHPSGRLIPLVLIGHAAYRVLVDRPSAGRTLRALVVAGSLAFVLFLPLGMYFVRHPGLFAAHPSDVSLAGVAAARYGGSLWRALAGQVAAVAGMFFLAGDPSTFHNLPGLPVFDPVSALAAVVGLGVILGRIVGRDREWRDRAVLLLLWLTVMLLPTLLSDRAPNYSRAIAALPVIVMLPALGVSWVWESLPGMPRALRVAFVAGAVLLAGLWTARNYFVVFATRTPHVYYSYDVEKLDAYAKLVDLTDEAEVFLTPPWAEHATIAYLNADGPVRTLDATDTLVLPASGRDAVVAFPAKEAEREGWIERAESLYGGVAQRKDLVDAQGRPLLVTYRVPAVSVGDLEPPADAPLEPEVWTKAFFGGAIRLQGYSVGQARPGEPLPITFVWQAVEPLGDDLTVFVHIVGEGGQAFGQEDREPGHATYRTSQWTSGDVVIDRYWPRLAADASGTIRIHVGWYDLETDRRLELPDGETFFRLKPLEIVP